RLGRGSRRRRRRGAASPAPGEQQGQQAGGSERQHGADHQQPPAPPERALGTDRSAKRADGFHGHGASLVAHRKSGLDGSSLRWRLSVNGGPAWALSTVLMGPGKTLPASGTYS